MNYLYRIDLGFLSSDDVQIVDSRSQLSITKTSPANSTIERTRKDRVRHALGTASKVAFSQLGLGKSRINKPTLFGFIFQ